MAITLDDATIRAQLHTDVKTAWSTLQIYDDASYGRAAKVLLPRAYVRLQDVKPVRGGGTAGIGETSLMHTYEIVGQFAWPTTTPIEVAKVLKSQSLINLLTANIRYSSALYLRDVTNVSFSEMFDQVQEPYYEITIEFAVEVTSAA